MNYAINGLIFVLRLCLSIMQINTGTAGGIVLGIVALVACVTTVMAWFGGTSDSSPRGWLLGILHLFPLFMQAGGQASFASQYILSIGFLIQSWSKLIMLHRTTVTGITFVSLAARGPYALVRHPMSLGDFLISFAVFVQNPSLWNICAIVLVWFSKVAIISMEEMYLQRFSAYRSYSEKVSCKMFPPFW